MKQYVNVAEELAARIMALIPTHPEIMMINSPWLLLEINEFQYKDLGPSLSQVSWALAKAKQIHKDKVVP